MAALRAHGGRRHVIPNLKPTHTDARINQTTRPQGPVVMFLAPCHLAPHGNSRESLRGALKHTVPFDSPPQTEEKLPLRMRFDAHDCRSISCVQPCDDHGWSSHCQHM